MTLEGTNSYLLSSSSSAAAVIIDPGPLLEEHLQMLAAQGQVELILLTHRHADHAAGASRLAELTGASVRAADPALCDGAPALLGGEVITVGGWSIRVIDTPGHTSDSVSFVLQDGEGSGAVLTGDTVLGRGSTVIDHPDGDLADYLQSLDVLAGLGAALVLPGHGQELPDLAAACDSAYQHRLERLDSVRAALLVLGQQASISDVADLVYTDIDPAVRDAAALSVAAQLHYLRGRS